MTQQLRVGHYLLGKIIGSGGFARVREGRHVHTNATVAVKIINKNKMKNKNMISKVKRQIRILKFITHPNVIRLYEVLDTSKDIFVVMELAQRGELYDYLQDHQLSEDKARLFFSQIIQGLEWTHSHLVAHRDLKPENILLDGQLNCKIADFGLSNLMKDGKHLNTSCGSLNYAPPEILNHQPYEGTAADIWSSGVILYTLLAGALPFDQQVVSILYKKIQKAQFTIPQQISPEARDLLKRMIVADPRQRITLKEIKIHPWLRKSQPLYLQVAMLWTVPPEKSIQINEEILQKVKKYNLQSLKQNLSKDQVKRMIKGRMDYSFVTAYELLRDKTIIPRVQSPKNVEGIITSSVSSKINRLRGKPVQGSLFGKSINCSVQDLFGTMLKVFREMQIFFTIKNNEYCINCSRGEEKSVKKLDWAIQLYQSEYGVIVDMRLVRGHPLNFLALGKKFYQTLQGFC